MSTSGASMASQQIEAEGRRSTPTPWPSGFRTSKPLDRVPERGRVPSDRCASLFPGWTRKNCSSFSVRREWWRLAKSQTPRRIDLAVLIVLSRLSLALLPVQG